MPQEDRRDEAVLAMIDDLEMQAEGLHLVDRALEVEALSVAGYAEVELVARLHGSVGSDLRVGLGAGLEVQGRLDRVGSDWLLIEDLRGHAWFVRLAAVAVVSGLAAHSVPVEARGLAARLSLRSVLRRLAEEDQACAVHLREGRTVHGRPTRVGADFLELAADPGDRSGLLTVPTAAIAVVHARSGGAG